MNELDHLPASPASRAPSLSPPVLEPLRQGASEVGWASTTFAAVLAALGARLLGTRSVLLILVFVLIAIIVRYALPHVTPRILAKAVPAGIRIDRIGARGIHRFNFVLPWVDVYVGHISLSINRPAISPSVPSTSNPTPSPDQPKPSLHPSSSHASFSSGSDAAPYQPWLSVIIRDVRVRRHDPPDSKEATETPERPSLWSCISSQVPAGRIPQWYAATAAQCKAIGRGLLAAALSAAMHVVPYAARMVDVRLEGFEVLEKGLTLQVSQTRFAAAYTLDSTLSPSQVAATTWLSRLPTGTLSLQVLTSDVTAYTTEATSPTPVPGNEAAQDALWAISADAGGQPKVWKGKSSNPDEMSTIPFERRVLFAPGLTSATLSVHVGDPPRQAGTSPGSAPVQVDVHSSPVGLGLDALQSWVSKLEPKPTRPAPPPKPRSKAAYELATALKQVSISFPFVRLVSTLPAGSSEGPPLALATDLQDIRLALRRATPDEPLCAQWLNSSVGVPQRSPKKRTGSFAVSQPTTSAMGPSESTSSHQRSRPSLAHFPLGQSTFRNALLPTAPVMLHSTLSFELFQTHLVPGDACLASIGPIQVTSAVSIPSHMLLPCTAPTKREKQAQSTRSRSPTAPSPSSLPSPASEAPNSLPTLDPPEPHEYPQCTIYTDVEVDQAAFSLPQPVFTALKRTSLQGMPPATPAAPVATARVPPNASLPQLHLGLHLGDTSFEVELPAPPAATAPAVPVDPKGPPRLRSTRLPGLQLVRISLPEFNVAVHGDYASASTQGDSGLASQYVFDGGASLHALEVSGGPKASNLTSLLRLQSIEVRSSGSLPAHYPAPPPPATDFLAPTELEAPVADWPIDRLPVITLDKADISSHTLIDGPSVHLDRPAAWDALTAAVISFAPPTHLSSPAGTHKQSTTTQPSSTVRKSSHTLALREVEVVLAMVDLARSSVPAGVRMTLSRAMVEAAVSPPPPTKAPLFPWDPRKTYGLEKTALDRAATETSVYGGHTSVSLATVDGLELHPLQPGTRPPDMPPDTVTDGIPIFALPRARVVLTSRPKMSEKQRQTYASRRVEGTDKYAWHEQSLLRANVNLAEPLCLSIQLANTYCLLTAGAGLRRIAQAVQSKPDFGPELVSPSSTAPFDESVPATEVNAVPRTTVEVNVTLRHLDIPIALPLGMQTFVGIRGAKASWRTESPLQLSWDELVGAAKRIHPPPIGGSSLPFESTFSEVVRSKDALAMVYLPLSPVTGNQPAITVNGDSLLISIPYNFRVYELIGATTVSMKATKQLIHEILLGLSGDWLAPTEQAPLRVPKIRLSFAQVVFEGEDDPFESALGRILCTGKTQQMARLTREAAFEDKMTAVFKAANDGLSRSSSVSSKESEGPPKPSPYDTAAIVRDARARLAVYEAETWTEQIKAAKEVQEEREEFFRHRLFQRTTLPRSHSRTPGGVAAQPSVDRGRSNSTVQNPWLVNVVSRPAAPPLFRLVLSNPLVRLCEPTFGRENTRAFITEHGGAIPAGLRFSTCAPFHFHWEMDEALLQIRDYPLPLLHVSPDMAPTDAATPDQPRPRTWVMEGDLCIAEQMGGPESTRYVPAPVVGLPEPSMNKSGNAQYTIHVPKVSLPTKWFGAPVVTIRSGRPLLATWGASYQAAVADMARTLESFSRPPLDPSRKIGFWDKLPLLFHGEVSFEFPPTEGEKPEESQSGVHLYLKGSRDPYALEGFGAGWVMRWYNGVTVTFGRDNPEMETLQFKSSKFILGIPDLSCMSSAGAASQNGKEVGQGLGLDLGAASDSRPDGNANRSSAGLPVLNYFGVDMSLAEHDLRLKKTVWHLGGAVTWGLGFKLERTCTKWDCRHTPRCQGEPFNRKCRFWDRISHWQVITKTPAYFESKPTEQRRDSYMGWRHDHIHFSIGVRSHEVDGTSADNKPNSLHVTPLTSAHFWAWINLYRCSLGLPIRQGKLFDSPQRPPKFGPHLATIKYRFDLAPLYFSHIYLQHDVEKYKKDTALYVGLKSRVDAFEVDVHQRQQATEIERKGLGDKKKVLHKPINELEVDFAGLEVRAVCAELTDTAAGRAQDSSSQQHDDIAGEEEEESATDRFLRSGPDASGINDGWWDLDDYVELGAFVGRYTSLPPTTRARTETVLQCPALNYYKKLRTRKEVTEELAESGVSDTDDDGGDPSGPGQQTHRSVLFATESKFGHEDTHTCLMGQTSTINESQQKIVRNRLRELRQNTKPSPEDRRNMKMLARYYSILRDADPPAQPQGLFSPARPRPLPLPINVPGMHENSDVQDWLKEIREMQGQWSLFSNRYLFHCPVVFISEVTRGVLTKYYHSNRDRRGFAHYLRAQALRTIRELDLGSLSFDLPSDGRPSAEELFGSATNGPRHSGAPEHGADEGGLGLLRNMLRDTVQSFNPLGDKSEAHTHQSQAPHERFDATVGIHPDFDVRMSTVCVLMRPQVVLRSEKEDASVIVSATRARLHNYTVRDYDFVDDDVNQQVMHRNMIAFDQVQLWDPPGKYKHGLPFEQLLSGEKGVSGLEPIIPRTNASLQYDKFNKLRLQDASKPCADLDSLPPNQDHLRYNMDLIRIHCPNFSITANHEQFSALYSVITGLVLYRDPAFQAQTKQLETILFAYNFHDPEELADIVETLQRSIRHTQHVFGQAEAKYAASPTEVNYSAAVRAYEHVVELHRELGLFNAAISVAQDRRSGSDKEKRSALLLEADATSVGWSMMIANSAQAMADLRIHGVHFQWLNKADNSALNRLVVDDMRARNNRPDALFTDMITKYVKNQQAHWMVEQGRFLDVTWAVLAPVGGISLIQQFELNLHPLRVQLEIAVGREIMAYIFGKREATSQSQSNQQNPPASTSKPKGSITGLKPSHSLPPPPTTSVASSSTLSANDAKRKMAGGPSLTSLHAPRLRSNSVLRMGLPRARSSADTLTLAVPNDECSVQHDTVERPCAAAQPDNESVAASGRSSSRVSSGAGGTLSSIPNRRYSPSVGTQPTTSATTPEHNRAPTVKQTSVAERDGSSQFGISVRNEGHAIALKSALEMRERAATNRTFVRVKIPQTVFCLSFKSDKGKSITDLYDVVVKSPEFEYHNQTWSYEDLVNHFKRKLLKAAWSQRTTLLRGFLTQRPRKISAKLALREKIRSQAGWAQKVIQELDPAGKDAQISWPEEDDDSIWLDSALASPNASPPFSPLQPQAATLTGVGLNDPVPSSMSGHSRPSFVLEVQRPTADDSFAQSSPSPVSPTQAVNSALLFPDQAELVNSPVSSHLSLEESGPGPSTATTRASSEFLTIHKEKVPTSQKEAYGHSATSLPSTHSQVRSSGATLLLPSGEAVPAVSSHLSPELSSDRLGSNKNPTTSSNKSTVPPFSAPLATSLSYPQAPELASPSASSLGGELTQTYSSPSLATNSATALEEPPRSNGGPTTFIPSFETEAGTSKNASPSFFRKDKRRDSSAGVQTAPRTRLASFLRKSKKSQHAPV